MDAPLDDDDVEILEIVGIDEDEETETEEASD